MGQASSFAVIGGGVVGVSVALALARRDADVVLLEAEHELARGASGTNSGILHTGFDAEPGSLEAQLIIRSAKLRSEVIPALGVPNLRPGALLRAADHDELGALAQLRERAGANGVEVTSKDEGSLFVPGESITDPVAYTLALAGAAARLGAEIAPDSRVERIAGDAGALALSADGERLRADFAVNCAGLHGDEVARAAGDTSFRIVPRKGEFFVFEPPARLRLEHILLPVPRERTKGVLVFPTVGGMIVAGPTAHDQEDKHDCSVRAEAREEVMAGAVRLLPELEAMEPVAAYAGLRPAGAGGVNYLIDWSAACPGLLHVGAIRSTGLSSSLGIAEHVAELLEAAGAAFGPVRPLERAEADLPTEPWWLGAARRQASRRAS
jgi:glycerol-3-phosphate dehydrogenase